MSLAVPVEAMVPVRTRGVELALRDRRVGGVLVLPAGAPRSATVVVPDRTGVREEDVQFSQHLAIAGHASLLVDLPVSNLDGLEVPSPAMGSWLRDFDLTLASGYALLAEIFAPPRRGLVGIGLGGVVALACGVRRQAGAVVSLYGEGPGRLRHHLDVVVDTPRRQGPHFLCLVGARDPELEPADARVMYEHFAQLGVRLNVVVYPRVGGAFCTPSDARYRPVEAADAREKVLQALDAAPRIRHRFTAGGDMTTRRSKR